MQIKFSYIQYTIFFFSSFLPSLHNTAHCVWEEKKNNIILHVKSKWTCWNIEKKTSERKRVRERMKKMKQHWKIGVIYIFICFASIASDMETSGRFCEPIKIPMCQNLGMNSCSLFIQTTIIIVLLFDSALFFRNHLNIRFNKYPYSISIQAIIWQKCQIWLDTNYKVMLIWLFKHLHHSFSTVAVRNLISSFVPVICQCAQLKSIKSFPLVESFARLFG